jgi:hypothetical protein
LWHRREDDLHFSCSVNSEDNSNSKENRRGQRQRRPPAAKECMNFGCFNSSGIPLDGSMRGGSNRIVY